MTHTSPSETTSAPVIGVVTGLALLASVGLGAVVATFVLPSWLPGLAASLTGPTPQAFWFLSRASALVAYGLLWISMSLGVTISNRLARLWPGGPVAFDVHQHTSVLGLAFAVFHVLVLLGDRYAAYTPWQLLVPFASVNYQPLWVGLGQIGLYLMAVVVASFYVKPLIGARGWRLLHGLSFGVYALALGHGIFSGSDSAIPAVAWMYWLSGGGLLFLVVYRVLARLLVRPEPHSVPESLTRPLTVGAGGPAPDAR